MKKRHYPMLLLCGFLHRLDHLVIEARWKASEGMVSWPGHS